MEVPTRLSNCIASLLRGIYLNETSCVVALITDNQSKIDNLTMSPIELLVRLSSVPLSCSNTKLQLKIVKVDKGYYSPVDILTKFFKVRVEDNKFFPKEATMQSISIIEPVTIKAVIGTNSVTDLLLLENVRDFIESKKYNPDTSGVYLDLPPVSSKNLDITITDVGNGKSVLSSTIVSSEYLIELYKKII